MGFIIVDGGGTGRTATVSTGNRLQTQSVSFEVNQESVVLGSAFIVATDFVALTTTGSYNAILYYKNTSSIRHYVFGSALAGLAAASWRIVQNGTAGTIVSDASAAGVSNANFGSTKTLAADAFKASGDGKTLTDGTTVDACVSGVGTLKIDRLTALDPGNSLSVLCKPSAATDVSATYFVTNQALTEAIG